MEKEKRKEMWKNRLGNFAGAALLVIWAAIIIGGAVSIAQTMVKNAQLELEITQIELQIADYNAKHKKECVVVCSPK